MRKSILFVLHRIGIGGSMTSMLNLLELLKGQDVEIDLFLMEHEGVFLERAKKAANLLKEDLILASVICNRGKLIKSKNLIKIFVRLVYVMAHKLFGATKVNAIIYRWRAQKLTDKYDNVIAFQENNTTNFVQYIEANNKIAWVHNDYERFAGKSTVAEMQKVYDNFHKVVCVSDASRLSMIKKLINMEQKISLIYNSFNAKYIQEKSCEYLFEIDRGLVNFVSIGRFAEQKCFDRVIEVSCKLLEEGYKFRWYIVGEGDLFSTIKQEVKTRLLEDAVILLGAQSNPYPIIKAVDYVVITSFYEAHPMVAIEGLILHRPVISTAFSSVYEVISDKKNGLICENSVDGIYVSMKELLDNKKLRGLVKEGAETFAYNNAKIYTQVKELLL